MRLPPILKALIVQLMAVAMSALILRYVGLQLPLLIVATIIGAVAAGLSYLTNFPRWWLPIQLLFVPALAMMMWLNIPAWSYLAGFILLAGIYWSTYRSQVPLYLSSRAAWRALEGLLPHDRVFKFADLGAGLGGVLAHLAKIRQDGLFIGVENAPLPFLLGWLRLQRHMNCTMRREDFWQMNFGDYDVVYAYLSPVPMPRLWEKVCREMKPGSLFISNTFEIPGQHPDQIVELDDFHRSRLLVWKIR